MGEQVQANTELHQQTLSNLNFLKAKLRKISLIGALIMSSITGVLEHSEEPAQAATTFTNTYPYNGAMDYNPSTYTWWVDEDRNGKADVTALETDDDEAMSPYGYYYRNCTDGVAYWLKENHGVDARGMGNANTWDERAPNYGFKVKGGNGNDIEVGDVAQSDDGYYGHVGYVTGVTKDSAGKITSLKIAEYNKSGKGEFTHTEYTSKNSIGNFLQSSGGRDWERFIDVNGPNAVATPKQYGRTEAFRAADINGDGFDDIFASGKRGDQAQNEIVSRGGNWLGAPTLFAAPPEQIIKFADATNLTADIDGDGKDDLITITNLKSDGPPSIYWQRSTGSSFESPKLVGVPSLISKNTRWAAGDFNGDGYDDILAISKRGDAGANLLIIPSTKTWLGAMAFWGATGSDVPFETSVFLPGDQNGDGKEDLYAISKLPSRVEPHVYRMRSNGQNFESPALTAIPGGAYDTHKFTAIDIDADGKSDLLDARKRPDGAPDLYAMLTDGDRSYKNIYRMSAPGEIKWSEYQGIPADLDKDGDEDVIAIQSSGGASPNPQLWWIKNNRTSFAQPVLVGQPNVTYGDYRYGQ